MPIPLNSLVKKIHMYAGLLSFMSFTVFGIAGLNATFRKAPGQRKPLDATVTYVDFAIPGESSDRELADRIYRTLRIPLSDPPPDWALARNNDNRLQINFYTVNGPRRVIVHEEQNRLEVRTEHQSIWQRFSNLHETTIAHAGEDLLVRLWAYYMEFSVWSLMGMALSGVYLWLVSRPRLRLAQYSFAVGSAVFVLLYILTR